MKARCVASFVALLIGAVSVLSFTSPAGAQVASGPRQRRLGGIGTNWSNSAGPGNGDSAVVANGGTVTIGLSGGGTFPASGAYGQILTGSGSGNGNVVQLDGTTVNTGYFSIGYMSGYGGPQVKPPTTSAPTRCTAGPS